MSTITPADLRQLLLDLDCRPADLARRLRVQDATVSRWLAGERTPTGLYAIELERLFAQAAVRKAQREGPRGPQEVRAIVNRIIAEITPEQPDPGTDYERGYLDGFRAATEALLESIVTKALTERPTPHREETHDRDKEPAGAR